jgi:succinylglutamate desuccinylase
MNSTRSAFELLNPHQLPESASQWLLQLLGPSKLIIKGNNASKSRVIVTLTHGNEPSGFEAVYRYLLSEQVPVCDTIVYFPNVQAAQKAPLFSHRNMLDGNDLNRCFTPTKRSSSDTEQLAQLLLADIESHSPEAVLDIHNTSGDGPAFAVATQETHLHKLLIQGFTEKLIVTNLAMNSLMEQDLNCPVVTIEAGGRQQQQSHNTAYKGLSQFLAREYLFDTSPLNQRFLNSIDVLRFPHRLEIKSHATLAYAEQPQKESHITVVRDIERHNFSKTNSGELLAWCQQNPEELFEIGHEGKQVPLQQYFLIEDDQLLCKYDMRLFMCTSNADIAKSDCLLYFIMAD